MEYSELFQNLINDLGEVGVLLRQIDSAEGRAGNMSAELTREHLDGLQLELDAEWKPLPGEYPSLDGRFFVVTGSGKRLWQIRDDPVGNLCIVRIGSEGKEFQIVWGGAGGVRPTSEFNSHLGVYAVREEIGQPTPVVIHAQPLHLTTLSHSPEFAEQTAYNRAIFCWQPETIVLIPDGIGFIAYQIPGTSEQETATAAAFRKLELVVWAKHGVVSIGPDLMSAFDLIDITEVVARYFFLNRSSGLNAPGFTPQELKEICDRFDIESPMLEEWLGQ